MLAKFLKSAIVLAIALTFFGGTAMADRWERGRHHSREYHHYHPAVRPHYVHRVYVPAAPARAYYRQPQHRTSALEALAPRIVFLGPVPIPVPPPPNEVLDYLTGR
jgi:hypothetical protein